MTQPLYDSLRGNWSINRVIDDRRAQQKGKFVGVASFCGQAGTLLYTEEGELDLGGAKMRASRRYQWSFQGLTVSVAYADGQPFHEFDLSGNTATASHLCGDDTYYGEYAFYLPDQWQVIWTVSGPRKDYTSKTLYGR